MNTLQQDLDDLDRMVDNSAAKDAIRSQIRLIAREVSTLEAEYASLAEAHAKLQQAHLKANEEHATLVAKLKKRPLWEPSGPEEDALPPLGY